MGPSEAFLPNASWRPRPPLPGTTLLAWRNLVHERARFLVTLIGIVFSVVLMNVMSGLLFGFADSAGSLVARADADLWIVPKGTTNVDIAGYLPESRRFQALAVPGVARVDHYFLQFNFWKKPDGGTESVAIIGINPYAPRGGPWNLVEGRTADLQQEDGVIVERLYADKLGVHRVGDTAEISGQRVRVVGFTEGIRTFTQSPYLFTSYRNAQRYTLGRYDRTTFLLVKLAPGYSAEAVRDALQARLGAVDVWLRGDFEWQTIKYWLITTGAGSALLAAALLGLIVGVVIVGQTLYASTVDRIDEYATLRAMGAPGRYLYAIILKQAAISAVLGFGAAMAITALVVRASARTPIAIHLPGPHIAVLALLTLAMCLFGAIISIRRVMHIDPTSVFR